ncbi:WD40-repeat-containing domain protein [Vararia minispora EC-137]|uniref:WD40-repeat-containing domain protein n=1 Tax=Vararia minispora EC-137 TaxID=1314806 RepID=A0ACB8QPN9_9AGAM|nr:WD40-repeat-containing domain protein [Vararia minispora EC-137]
MSHAATISSRPRAAVTSKQHVDFATLGRAPMRLGLGSRRVTSHELGIVEAASELLSAPIPDDPVETSAPSLLRGFQATIPSADKSRTRRRQTRSVDTPHLGLKKRTAGARGMMIEGSEDSEDDFVAVGVPDKERGRKGRRKRGRESLAANKTFGRDELDRQIREIRRDKENLHVRRSLVNSEIDEISQKIAALDVIRSRLEDDLLKLQEDELELDDELEMVKEQLNIEESRTRRGISASSMPAHMQSSRRRKGPAFLPSEHDDLPPGVAFMTLEAGMTPVTALDFSEPYGTLVTATQDEPQPRVWDLLSGEEIGRLRGHTGIVKAVQVEDHICLTGSEDGSVRMWDLRRVDEDEWDRGLVHLDDVVEEDESQAESESVVIEKPNGIRNGVISEGGERGGQCVRVLEGHSKAVTALYFEEDTLVTGASDKTIRQWDLTTGQCVMTMDLLWALSHSSVLAPSSESGTFPLPGATAAAGTFAVPTPPYADGSWELYQDYIGSCQFWGYALVSGSGDGAVRMWDMRTGQTHRTLLGHTGPVTSLQFDEIHIVSGSLDRSIRIWDLRSGGIFETIKYDHGVTSLQFDSRKVVSAAGENGVKIYNRTSMQHSTLLTNGHTRPIEKLRYMDRYLVSGGRDSMVKIWAL